MAAPTSQPKDPNYKTFLAKVMNDFGMDPNQKIDMNDPMTKLTMTIILITIEQGRDLYSYDQYIKGCANSIGIDPAVFDKEVNPTSLGFENNSGNAGYVPPSLPSVKRGGSTIPLNPSTYITAGINAALNVINANSPVPISTLGGVFSGISNSILGASNPVANFGGGGGVAGSVSLSGPIYAATTGDNAAILNTIKTVEASGNYGAINYTAQAVGFPKSIDTSNMTLAEVRAYQQSMLNAGADSSALGPYQMIGTTLDTYAAKAGISPDTKMTPDTWDKIGSAGVNDALQRSGGDISKIPVIWYSGNPNGTGVAPSTMAAYQQKWLGVYQGQSGATNNYQGPGSNPSAGPNQYPPGFDPASATKTQNSDGSVTYTDQNNQTYILKNGAWIDPGKDQVVGVTTSANGQILSYPPGVNSSSYQIYNPDGTSTYVGSSGDAYILKNGNWYNNQGDAIGVAGAGYAINLKAAPDPAVVANGLGIQEQLTVTSQTNADGSFRYATYTDSTGNKFWIDNKGAVTTAIDESGNAIPISQRQVAQFNSMGTFSQMPTNIDPNNIPLPPRQFADVPLPPARPSDLASDGFTRPTDPSGAMLTPNFDSLAPSVKNSPIDTSTLPSSDAALKIAQSRVDAAANNLSNLETGAGNSAVNASQRAAAAQEYNDAVTARDQIQNNMPTQTQIVTPEGTATITTPVTLGYSFNNPGMQNTANAPVGPIDVVPSYNAPTYGTVGPTQPIGFNTVSIGSSNTIIPAAPPQTVVMVPTVVNEKSGDSLYPTAESQANNPVNALPSGNTVFPSMGPFQNTGMGTASTPNYPNYSAGAVQTIAGGTGFAEAGQSAASIIPGPSPVAKNQVLEDIKVQSAALETQKQANETQIADLKAKSDDLYAQRTAIDNYGISLSNEQKQIKEITNQINQDVKDGKISQNSADIQLADYNQRYTELGAEQTRNNDAYRSVNKELSSVNSQLNETGAAQETVNQNLTNLQNQQTEVENQPDQNSTVNVPPDPNTYAYTAETPAGISPAEAAGIPQTNQIYGFGEQGATGPGSGLGYPVATGFGINGATTTSDGGATTQTVAPGSTTFSPAAGGNSVSGSSPAAGAASAASPGGAAASASSAANMPQGC